MTSSQFDTGDQIGEHDDAWYNSNDITRLSLPPLKCSKYSVIGEPKARRRRGEKGANKGWRVPVLPKLQTTGQRSNAIDKNTIYSGQQNRLYKVLSEDRDVPSPLKCSPRVQNFSPDPQYLQEKSLVMNEFFAAGPMKKYERDRAVIPSVYADFFDCPRRRKSYVRDMFSVDFRRRNGRHPVCDKRQYRPEDGCHFCDVVGNKYCAFCTELKNRNFALSYEQHYLPLLSPSLPDYHSSKRTHWNHNGCDDTISRARYSFPAIGDE